MNTLLKRIYFPLMLGFGVGSIIWIIGSGEPVVWAWSVLAAAILLSFIFERLIPWQVKWNRSMQDSVRDWLHFIVNTSLNHSGLLLLPMMAALAPASGLWPHDWPFWLQVIVALLVLDFGIAAAHHQSHRWHWLWQFHAVHHSVNRMYGLNGLMKHPFHQAIETLAGIVPLWILGLPMDVAQALAFCVAIQLLLQHANVDYRTGPLKYLFANAEVHRFHHLRPPANGDVNFGLFTTLYDHLFGTFFYDAALAPRESNAIGLADEGFPSNYASQLVFPFKKVS